MGEQDNSSVVVENRIDEELSLSMKNGGKIILAPKVPVEITPQLPHLVEGLLDSMTFEGKINVHKGCRVCGYCGSIVRAPFPWVVKMLEYQEMVMCNSCVLGRILWANEHGHALEIKDRVPNKEIKIITRTPMEWMRHYGKQMDVLVYETVKFRDAMRELVEIVRGLSAGNYNTGDDIMMNVEEVSSDIRKVVESLTGVPFCELKL